MKIEFVGGGPLDGRIIDIPDGQQVYRCSDESDGLPDHEYIRGLGDQKFYYVVGRRSPRE